MEPISELINKEQKLFDDKQLIKPWLQSKLTVRGINIVIERSDESKIVFKCKCCYNDKEELVRYKKERKLLLKSNPYHCQSKQEIVLERKKIRDMKKKFNCPFRIRANYSYRSKNWSLVVVNEIHNHPLFPIANGAAAATTGAPSGINTAAIPRVPGPPVTFSAPTSLNNSPFSATSSPPDASSPLSSVNSPHNTGGGVFMKHASNATSITAASSNSNYQYSSRLPSLPTSYPKRHSLATSPSATPLVSQLFLQMQQTNSQAQTNSQSQSQTNSHSQTHSNSHSQTHSHSQSHSNSHSQSHSNSQSLSNSLSLSSSKKLNDLQLEFNNSLLRLNCNMAREEEIKAVYVKLLNVLETSMAPLLAAATSPPLLSGPSKTILPSIQETFRYNHASSVPHQPSQLSQSHSNQESPRTQHPEPTTIMGDNAFLRF